jgi:hypothetical protein
VKPVNAIDAPDVVQIVELAASGQNIHRQALSAKAKSATGSSACVSFASGSFNKT